MHIHADFSKPAMTVAGEQEWIHSPESGVDRIMLDRIGDEVARATSIVRYAPGSSFPEHQHAKGEEFLVLEGIFSDESGDFPTGTYVRNPPGSSHAPGSVDGCRILVKLRQFEPDDLTRVVIDTNDDNAWQDVDDTSARLPLHEFGNEKVAMLKVGAGSSIHPDTASGGAELFVVGGSLDYEGEALIAESWLRLPAGTQVELKSTEPSLVWIKTGHLPPGS